MPGELLVVVYDVQHGSATYVQTPNEKHLMIDLGTGSIENRNATFSPLLRLKEHWKVERLDLVVVTHPHRDHIDDIFNFHKLWPRALRRPRHLTDDEIRDDNRRTGPELQKVEKYLEICKRYTGITKPGNMVQNPFNNGGVKIRHFHPKHCATSNLNNHSIVTVLSYAGSKVLIPGDNENASWEELLDDHDFVETIKDTNVLVAPHHGRESGYSERLFEHIKPDLVIVSDGPEGETSVTDWYHAATTEVGCKVASRRTAKLESRWVVTTRNDGHIVMRFGVDGSMRRSVRVSVR